MDQTSHKSSCCFQAVTLARIGLVAILMMIGFASRFGRMLDLRFPMIVSLIPWLVSVIIIIGLTGFIFFLHKKYRQHNFPLPLKEIIQLCSITLIFSLLVGIIGELSIVLPIERIHYLKFGSFSFLFYFSQKSPQTLMRLGLAIASGCVLGTLEECLQIWSPERVFDLRDIRLNCFGAILGSVYAYSIHLWYQRIPTIRAKCQI